MKSKYKNEILNIIYLSDSEVTDTNIPYRIIEEIKKIKPDNKCSFLPLKLNIKDLKESFQNFWNGIKTNKHIIIHSHHPKSLIINILIKLFFSKLFKKKVISCHTFHCEFKRFSKLKLIPFYFSKYIIDIYFAVSDEVKIKWKKFLKREIKLSYIGITYSETQTIKNLSTKARMIKLDNNLFNDCNVTWLGRLEEIKRPLFLLDSLESFKSNKDIKIIINIVGKGTLQSKVEKKISSLNKYFQKININIKVIYLGFFSRTEVYDLIASTDIYVCSSSSEAFCTSALEFLMNPYCRLLLPDIKSLKNIYSCDRTIFFKKNDKKQLFDNLNSLVESYIVEKNSILDKNYPKNFEKLNLNKLAQDYLFSYFSEINK